MSLLKRRALSFQDVWGADSGTWVDTRLTSAETALGVSAVLAAVDLIASRIQMMTYAEVTMGADGLEQPLPMGQFLREPSSTLAPDEWIYQGAASYLLYGKVAGYITARGANGWPTKLDWLNPDKLTATTSAGVVRWAYAGQPIDSADLVQRQRSLFGPGCRAAAFRPKERSGVSHVQELSCDLWNPFYPIPAEPAATAPAAAQGAVGGSSGGAGPGGSGEKAGGSTQRP
mgnify:CR=1 FL=1